MKLQDGDGYPHGCGRSNGNGYGTGTGNGYVDGDGYGYGDGSGYGYGCGNSYDDGSGNGTSIGGSSRYGILPPRYSITALSLPWAVLNAGVERRYGCG